MNGNRPKGPESVWVLRPCRVPWPAPIITMAMHTRFISILAALALLPGFACAQLLPEKDIASVSKPALASRKAAAVDILVFFKKQTSYYGGSTAVTADDINKLLEERSLVLVDVTPEGLHLVHVPNPKNASAARADLLTHPIVLSATPSGWNLPARRKIEFSFRTTASQDARANLLRDYGLSLVQALSADSFVAVSEFSREYEKLVAKLTDDPLIVSASLR